MNDLLDALFVTAGGALVGHVLLCAVLQYRLRDHAEVLGEVFAVPNSKLSSGLSFRLLRARYYLPWKTTNFEHVRLDSATRSLLLIARITGIVMPVASLAFFLGSLFQGVA